MTKEERKLLNKKLKDLKKEYYYVKSYWEFHKVNLLNFALGKKPTEEFTKEFKHICRVVEKNQYATMGYAMGMRDYEKEIEELSQRLWDNK